MSGAGGSCLGASVSGSALGNLHSRIHRGVWTVGFPVAALGLVFLALFWPDLDGLSLWVWVGLGFALDGGGGIMGFGGGFLLCCWSDVGISF